MSLNKLLGSLSKVRQKRNGQWEACCPAHNDKSPSLSIGEGSDGRVLIKCWAGCSALDVIASVGLDWQDLYPDADKNYRSLMAHMSHRPKHLELEDRVIELGSLGRLSDKDRDRLKAAALRGGERDGFIDEVRREASKALPSERMSTIRSRADRDAIVTELNWLLDHGVK